MVATSFLRAGVLASLPFSVTWAAEAVQRSETCDSVCQHIHDPSAIDSIGRTIEDSVSTGTNPDIIKGRRSDSCAGFYDASAIWSIWSNALEVSYPSKVSQMTESGSLEDRVCVDKVALARLTAAASNCHSSSGSWSSNTTGGMNFPDGGGSIHSGGGGLNVQPGDGGHINIDTSGSGGGGSISGGGGSISGGGGSISGGGGSISGGGGSISGGGGSTTGGGGGGNFASGGGSGTTSSSGWGHGNVHTESICFKIKDKRSDRYLTSGGTEFAYAYYPNYYSIFRAYPIKSAPGSYTLTEINRSGATVNYPVKLNPGLGQFKPLYGDQDATFTFSPTNFGDSCWGVPGRKMSRRHDWGGWGDNYRQVTSGGEDCADVELEEAAC